MPVTFDTDPREHAMQSATGTRRDTVGFSDTEEEAHRRIVRLRRRIDADNERRRAEGRASISRKEISRERGSTTNSQIVYDRAVLSAQKGKLILDRIIDLEEAYDRILEREAERVEA